MNGIEDRLREELKEFSLRAQPESLRPLRPPAPRRRTRTIRWLAPVAAATAVVAVVAGATLAGHTMAPQPASKGHAKVHNYPLIPAYPGMPAYYVVLRHGSSSPHGQLTETAEVYDTVSGRLLGKVQVPGVRGISEGNMITAAADDREFVISGIPNSIFFLHLAADGHAEGLRRITITHARPQDASPVISPDGSRVAYTARVCENGRCESGIGVTPISQPDTARFWVGRGLSANDLSWAPDGKQVMFGLDPGPQDNVFGTQYRLLNVTGPDGNLLTDSQPIRHLPEGMLQRYAMLTPDGRDVVGVIVLTSLTKAQTTATFVEVSRRTGRQRVLYVMHSRYQEDGEQTGLLALASTGVQLFVASNTELGLIEDGRFIPRPGYPSPNEDFLAGSTATW